MKILITGSSGFIGKNIIKRLMHKHTIISFDITEGRDILNKKTLNKYMQNIDIVIHLAALLNQAESWKKPDAYLKTNVYGTYNVLTSASDNNVKRVINLSSAAVYASPQTPYGLSKKLAENVCKNFKKKLEVITFRPFNVYGENQNPSYNYVLHSFIGKLKHNQPVTIYGNGKQTRDFLYIDDLIDVVETTLSSPVIYSPIDIGTGYEITMNDLALLVAKLLRKKLGICYLPKRKEPFKSKANTSKLLKMGVSPKKFLSIEEGLKILITSSGK